MYTPVNPSLYIYKWGLKGSKLYRRVFVMVSKTKILKFNTNCDDFVFLAIFDDFLVRRNL